MTLGLLMAVVVSALNMVNPTVAGTIVDRVIRGGEKGLLWRLVVLMVSTTLLKCVIRFAYQMIFEHVSQNVIRNIRQDLYDTVQSLDFAWFDKSPSGNVMTLMTSDLDAVRHFVAWVIYMTFENVLIFSFSIALLASISVPFTLMMLAVTPFIAALVRRFAKKIKPAHMRTRDQFARLNTTVSENIAGNRVVKAFVREDYETAKFMRENESYRDCVLEQVDLRASYIPLIDAIVSLLPVVLVLGGGYMIIKGNLTLGELVTFNGLMWALSNPLNMLGGLVNDAQRFAASADRLYELSRQRPSVADPARTAAASDAVTAHAPADGARAPAKPATAIRGDVEFRDVSFSYGAERVLDNVSFVAKSGTTVGILGPTGAGKSTLAKLLCRFYDCDSGSVSIDGRDVRELPLETVRRNVGITMQDVFLFSDTIEGNIAFGKPDASEDEVHRAAREACADEFIRELADGYDTIVGERGVGLSGGQRQRIALARLMAVDAPVVILDDTTSSVDAETEQRIRASIDSLAKRRTTFIISHRVSSIEKADLILVMDKGRIADRGTHEELVARGGYYRDVWQHQNGV
jgi:ATP-binding cassette, subfamily B, multidrug efflux pump